MNTDEAQFVLSLNPLKKKRFGDEGVDREVVSKINKNLDYYRSEYELIKSKKSSLSAKERKEVTDYFGKVVLK